MDISFNLLYDIPLNGFEGSIFYTFAQAIKYCPNYRRWQYFMVTYKKSCPTPIHVYINLRTDTVSSTYQFGICWPLLTYVFRIIYTQPYPTTNMHILYFLSTLNTWILHMSSATSHSDVQNNYVKSMDYTSLCNNVIRYAQ